MTRHRPAPRSPLFALTLASQAVLAQDTPDGHWHGGLSLALARFASGNTSSRTLAANADTSARHGR